MDNNKGLGLLLIGFITILLAIILVQEIASSTVAATETSSITNETVTITSGSGKTNQNGVISVSFFGNGTTNTIVCTTFDINSQINFTKNGSVSVAQGLTAPDECADYNGSIANGGYNISYVYEGDNYVSESTSRVFLKLIPLFFVIGILAAGIYVVFKINPDLFSI